MVGLSAGETERIGAIFRSAGLPTGIQLSAGQRKQLLGAMRLDKKVSGGEVKFVLAKRIGETSWGEKVPEGLVLETLKSLAQ
jgi:3-dehydroquinate synthetase